MSAIDIDAVLDGKYHIKKELGKGGMGSVYEAEHTGTGRRVAIKVINSPEMIANADVVSRFQREARAAGAIDTQYITQVLDAGIDRQYNLPFLAMEYMDGEDVQQFTKRVGPISPDLALRVVAQSCLGLQKAHDENVVHRDIKPHNLFLAKRDAGEIIVKLLDFGIAKVKMDQAQDKDGAGLTKTGNLLGSPLYVSPEQARGKRGIDHRTDIWSLGAVLYQMLTGRTPFQHATALGELILMVCTEPPPPVQEHAPWILPEIAAIVHKCLEKDPDARFQNAQELFDTCRTLLPHGWTIHESMLVSLEDSQRQNIAAQYSVPAPSLLAASSSGQISAMSSTNGAGALAHTAQPATSGSKLPLLIAAVAVAVAGVGGFVMMQKDESTPTPPPAPTTQAAAPTAAPEAKPTATAAQPAVAPKKKRVRVVVLPDNASAEVEGEAVKLKDGILEIEGLNGSVHRVRIFKGTSEVTADVVVTEAGALPAKIEIQMGKKLHIPRGGSAATAASTGGAASPPPAGAVPTGISVSTDEFQ